ncbi:unnamed protein product [Linum tenue]|uniref:Uncharacterized protein n=1 Tax=Linum tenue TaxID=586396 RepID=A0AAV0MCM6_9ROSI|nr:unnamed protein product [Linum tenue]
MLGELLHSPISIGN